MIKILSIDVKPNDNEYDEYKMQLSIVSNKIVPRYSLIIQDDDEEYEGKELIFILNDDLYNERKFHILRSYNIKLINDVYDTLSTILSKNITTENRRYNISIICKNSEKYSITVEKLAF